ncbi:histidinol dehydrogenase [Acuticoccus sediminis]|uniref:Histidinol dehydrogenase n=1 Tax=Acuticoccus sediminis TaxID=2184697 RepID=A0A8B2NDQ3_9HYPH|nr:histidinol dehydrogenase [Acuticoccus sediminis]RAH96818.1 histidinol dehydrogenase [Acuticoccus sediminis]
MSVRYLKRGGEAPVAAADVSERVRVLLAEIEAGGEEKALGIARDLDGFSGDVDVGAEEIDAAHAALDPEAKAAIAFAHDNIRRFAEAQRATLTDTELEIAPGFVAGQRVIPVVSAGAYVPGGRFSHIASALMTITTARAAGVSHVAAVSPPRPGGRLAPDMVFAMALAGADRILCLGGVQGIAALAFGLFGLPKADILVGPGNAYVAEAKRQLFGRVGIDMVAGPTDSMILADDSADPETVAADLVGQMEHGADSPVWLVTTDAGLAEAVIAAVPRLVEALPEANAASARAAWRIAEVILADTREEMAEVADRTGPEHLHVQARDLDWWLARLTSYGSLFLGEETTVAFGDKAAGPNHVLPTSGAARYTGGLSVHKFLKVVTWQRASASGAHPIAEATARISRLEGMEAHARTADLRLTGGKRGD